MAVDRSMRTVAAVALSIGGVCAIAGCGEDRNYPEGFLAEAAKDGPALGAGAKASSENEAAAATAMGATGFRADIPAPAAPGEASGPTSETVNVDDAAAAQMVETLAAELKLPPPPETQVAAGEEPFQKLARSSKFDSFRSMSARYIQLRAQLLPYGQKLADGSATADERRTHNRIEEAMNLEFKRLNTYMWDSRFDEQDRAAMGWILYGGMQPK